MTRILLIEEDLAMRALVEEWLGSAGHGVTVEICHLNRLPRLPSLPPPALVIASMMNLRGPGALELQHLRGQFPLVPVLVLSGQLGHSLHHQSETAMSLGVSALLAKPFTQTEFLEAVGKALHHGH